MTVETKLSPADDTVRMGIVAAGKESDDALAPAMAALNAAAERGKRRMDAVTARTARISGVMPAVVPPDKPTG